MRPKRHDWRTGCSVEATLSVIGGLWKAVILFHLLDGKKRFGELSRLVPRATQRMLTLQLRELEADGVISRIVFPEVPPRVEYGLTERGCSLEPLLLTMRDWGRAFQGREPARTQPFQQTAIQQKRPPVDTGSLQSVANDKGWPAVASTSTLDPISSN